MAEKKNKFAMFTDGKGNQVNVGIKPRNWYLVAATPASVVRGTKSNTSKAKSSAKLGPHMAHVERHPTDKASRDHLAKRSA